MSNSFIKPFIVSVVATIIMLILDLGLGFSMIELFVGYTIGVFTVAVGYDVTKRIS